MEAEGTIAKLGSPPELSEWETEIYAAHRDLGRDVNGQPLYAEKREWLDEAGVLNPTTREDYLRLWREMEAEDAEIREEEMEKTRRQAKAGG